MNRLLAGFLTALILLQTFSRELVVLDYQVHKERITQMFCVNKSRPQLHCNGKCHLAKKLRKSTEGESKAPAAGFAKVKFEALPLTRTAFGPAVRMRTKAMRFATQGAVHYAFTPANSIFHPPAQV